MVFGKTRSGTDFVISTIILKPLEKIANFFPPKIDHFLMQHNFFQSTVYMIKYATSSIDLVIIDLCLTVKATL